jgi:chemotaxis signal transduction protein
MTKTFAPDQRFILTQVDDLTLRFSADWVAETLLIERAQIVSLPFYDPAILGCVSVGSQVVPLVSSAQFLGLKTSLVREVLTVVRLGEAAEYLAGVGILVDRMIGSQMGSQVSATFNQDSSRKDIQFDLTLLGTELFQPQRWRADKSMPH